MTVAIHQPNFVPWLPFFDKIRQADLFVVLAHCQYSSGVYQNRFRAREEWHTMGVVKNFMPIITKQYARPAHDWEIITRSFPKLRVFDSCISENLFQTNYCIIRKACDIQGIDRNKLVLDYPTELRGTARLVDICQRHGATTYLSGTSGKHYLNVEQFTQVGINVIFQEELKSDTRALVEIL